MRRVQFISCIFARHQRLVMLTNVSSNVVNNNCQSLTLAEKGLINIARKSLLIRRLSASLDVTVVFFPCPWQLFQMPETVAVCAFTTICSICPDNVGRPCCVPVASRRYGSKAPEFIDAIHIHEYVGSLI